MTDKPKVIVIGLDGATWDLIKPWADEGKLPTFKYLMENGAWGVLVKYSSSLYISQLEVYFNWKKSRKVWGLLMDESRF